MKMASNTQASTDHTFHPPHRGHNLLEIALALLNPTTLAIFAAGFGLVGLLCIAKLPALGALTLIPAFISGWTANQVVQRILDWLTVHLEASSTVKQVDSIGTMAEVTLPIYVGKSGEITYVSGSRRFSSPARSASSDCELPKGTLVMIISLEDGLAQVEPWKDSFVDPGFQSIVSKQKSITD